MNKSFLKLLERIAEENGLRVDQDSGVIFGVKSEYEVYLQAPENTRQFVLSVSVVNRETQALSSKEFKELVKQSKAIAGCNTALHKANFTINPGMSKNKTTENIRIALEEVISYLISNQYQNCCQECSAIGSTDTYMVAGVPEILCSSCFAGKSSNIDREQQTEKMKKENIAAGVVGALIGSLLGVASIIILGQLGYVASISGFIMAICVLKGYELLGGKLTIKGTIISVVIMLVMVFVGHQADWSITVMSYFETDFFTAFRTIPLLIEEEIIDLVDYLGNLGLVYLFTLVGAVPTIYNAVKKKKTSRISYKMGTQDNLN
ncbi:hypothetical protein [Scatolibacter rhodanostii]|uniref:hypothetical protein n=1 Tax=Scatolibacter rhodanostii TaxID=2014781 RepID=UPI000C06BE5F|nr:hypothetical protein [Scatolibacter rhodanostii]